MRHHHSSGLSLLESLMVIGVVLLLIVITFQSFKNLGSYETLDKEALHVVSILNEARSFTLASKNADQYGVHFTASQVTIFEGASYNSSDPNNIVIDIDPKVQITSITLTGGGSDVLFSRLTGETSQSGTTTLTLMNPVPNITNTKNVVISLSGIVNIR